MKSLVFTLLLGVALAFTCVGATLPAGFSQTLVATGLNITGITQAPDGRIFVADKAGKVRVIKNGALLAKAFLTVTVNSSGERGLESVVLDPNFATNHYVYIYYTATTPAVHNRVSRFTASGDTALPGETVLLDLNNLSTATNHNGGSMLFREGKLYISTGDNANGSNAQSFTNLLGKILRINPNGTIPTDNPYYDTASGVNKAIYALGFRNPFKMAYQPGTNFIYVNDVGQDTWEEINLLTAHKNYGWPITEGMAKSGQVPPADYQNPIYTYSHGDGVSCSITGGAFYNPPTAQFPSSYVGKYFFADYCGNYIKMLQGTGSLASVTTFATGLSAPVDVLTGLDGSLYYAERGSGGNVWRVTYTAPSTGPLVDGGTYYLQLRHDGLYMDVNGGSTANNAAIVQNTFSGANRQRWVARASSDGYYRFQNVNSGKYLSIQGAGLDNGVKATQYEFNTNPNKEFKPTLYPGTTEYYTLTARHSGKCLGISNSLTAVNYQLDQWTCGTYTSKQFKFTRIGTTISREGALEEALPLELALYPNPASDEVTVEGANGPVTVRDALGRVVLAPGSGRFSVRGLEAGVYFVETGRARKRLAVVR